jgi:tetratricopeptide (TPR) repeat protein
MTDPRPDPLRPLLPALIVLLVLCGCFHRGVTPIHTHFNKGVYHYARGDVSRAIGEYRMAVEEDPGDWQARFNLAEALEAAAQQRERGGAAAEAEELRQEAEEHYLRLLADDPDNLRAAVNLSAREFQHGDEDAAEARLRDAVARHPRAALPRVALAAHRLRQARHAARDEKLPLLREAVEILEEAHRREPSDVDADMLLGHAVSILARRSPEGERDELVDRARQAFLQALHHDESDLATLLALARLERRAGNLRQAEQWLRRALYVDPDLLTANLMISRVLSDLGDLEGATTHLWRSRELEDELAPRLSEDEYRQRLLELYRRLIEQESADSP